MKAVFKNQFFLILVIILLGASAYSFGLNDSFKTVDDKFSIVENDDIKSFSNTGKIFTESYFRGSSSFYRPLVNFSYMLEHHFFGLNAKYFYITNIIIHLLNAILLFFIIELLFVHRVMAFSVALLFVLHPVHWEAVSNIPGRSILLSAFFNLSAFLLFLRAYRKKHLGLFICSILFFILSFLCKESAVALPIMIGTYLFLTSGAKMGRVIGILSPYLLLVGIFVGIRQYFGITRIFFWRSLEEGIFGFLTFLRSLITHLRILVWPMDLHFDRSQRVFTSFADLELIITILFFICLIVLLWQSRRKFSNLMIFFLAWFLIELLPVSQIGVSIGVMPGYISAADHFLYLPSIGIFVLMALGVGWLFDNSRRWKYFSKTSMKGLAICFYAFLFLVTVQQNIYSQQELSLFKQALKYEPHNIRMRSSYALSLTQLRLYEQAEMEFRKILDAFPQSDIHRIRLGRTLHDQGRYWEAIEEYEKVQNAGDFSADHKKFLNFSYKTLIEKYQKQLKREPDNAQLLYSLGVVYSKKESWTEAIDYYKMALAIDPFYKNALFNLASSFKAAGQDQQAIMYYGRMLELDGIEDELDEKARMHLDQMSKGIR